MATQFSICLWGQNAKGMAQYYQEVFNDFKLVSENPMAVVFEMIGKRFMCLNNCTPNLNFNEKISFVLTVDTQDEIDYYWNYFTKEGQAGQCGWLEDKYGVSWQVVPGILGKLMTNPETAPKATYAFMQMSKFDIAKLQEAVK
ncbi:MAG: VOC family protein [Bacteroidota bacterium]|jgi:predicted 3-demethylubiquinone-9 3-methyltransferase (glyoxalase superfamily)